ncbi:MAG: transcriptional regulator [Verrucomicrobiota bacterium]
MNPSDILQLDRVVHERVRLAIMSMLAASPDLSFTEVRDALDLTDGNLMSHVRTLQEAGYLAVTKAYQEARPLTTLALTKAGREAFAAHIARLAAIVQHARPA